MKCCISRFLKTEQRNIIIALINKIFCLVIVFECAFIFLFSYHQNIALFFFLKYRCLKFITIKLPAMGKSNQKIRNTYSYPSFQKHCLTSHIDIGGHKKKEVTGNSKTTTLTYFGKLKKK